jgi:ATP-dependent Lhr-like helicase
MDEIHLLFGTARGKQLQWLLKRLQRLRRFLCTSNPRSDDSLQLVCLSATLPEPELVAESFLGNEHHIVTVPGSREIVTVSVDSCNPAVESVLPAYAEQLEGPEKILVFCNRKKRVDGLAGVLKKRLPAGFSVYAHHGNLGRSLREKAEKALKMEPRVVLVATSTLEIGIDIGDVDLIVLDGPPPDVSSLLQRIGRGNRRTNMTRVMMCSNNYREVIIHSAMLEAAINGDFVRSANKTNYGVIIQQVASYIFQSPKKYRTRGKLLEFVDYCETGLNSEQVLDSLIGQGEFSEKPGNVISLGKEWLERSERGAIHSNIENAFGISVRDGRTGEIFATGINVQQKGSKLSIGGNLLSVRSWRDRVVDVKNLENPKSLEVSWNYFSNSWVDSDEQPYCVRKYLDISEDEWPVFSHADKLYAFHFGGVRRRLFLEMAKTLSPEPKAIRITNWFVSADNFNQLEQLKMFAGELNQEFIEQYILNHIDSLEKKLGRPVINKRLPDDLRRQEILSWMGVAREKQSLRQVRLTTPTEPEVLRVLKIFVQDS